jgi:hypothetical protein
MTLRPGREAITLPLLFLTVALMGGFRSPTSGGMKFVAPDLVFLVLGVLLLGAAFRSGLLVPGLLMSDRRAPLENLSGSVVLLTLFLASAQVVNILAPEEGLLHLLYCFFFTALLWNTMAAQPDRRRLLHSLFVILASAFLFKYVLLSGLYDPEGGLTRRVLTALLEGVALGTLQYQPFAPATGYVAFFTVVLYLAGLALLPVPQKSAALVRVEAEDVLDVQPT